MSQTFRILSTDNSGLSHCTLLGVNYPLTAASHTNTRPHAHTSSALRKQSSANNQPINIETPSRDVTIPISPFSQVIIERTSTSIFLLSTATTGAQKSYSVFTSITLTQPTSFMTNETITLERKFVFFSVSYITISSSYRSVEFQIMISTVGPEFANSL